jgi:hypothetical protein
MLLATGKAVVGREKRGEDLNSRVSCNEADLICRVLFVTLRSWCHDLHE